MNTPAAAPADSGRRALWNALLTPTPAKLAIFKANRTFGLTAPEAPPVTFSPFDPDQLRQAVAVSETFGRVADDAQTAGTDAALQAVRAEYDRLIQVRNPELVEYGLKLFMAHHPVGRTAPIPPLLLREAELVVPSRAEAVVLPVAAARTLTNVFAAPAVAFRLPAVTTPLTAFSAPPATEAALNWFREEPFLNEHHGHWHLVYDGGKDRQGEQFVYMHRQMIARYDAERRAVGLPPVKALCDLSAEVPAFDQMEGYEPNIGRNGQDYLDRADGLAFFAPEDTALEQDWQRQLRRLREYIRQRVLPTSQGPIPLRPRQTPHPAGQWGGVDLLGAFLEPTISLGAPDLTDFMTWYHGWGHMEIDKKSGGRSVMGNPETSMRDVIFWRWHKHIDELAQNLEKQFDSRTDWHQPRVRLTKYVDAAGAPHTDALILCTYAAAELPAAADLTALGTALFGGARHDQPVPAGPVSYPDGAPSPFSVTDTLHTTLRKRTFNLPVAGQETPVELELLSHDRFCYFVRVHNEQPMAQAVTVRAFLVPEADADDRTRWIELDKYYVTVPPGPAVIGRRDDAVTVIRQEYLAASDLDVFEGSVEDQVRELFEWHRPNAGGPVIDNEDAHDGDFSAYCSCGWPYHLLLPRGTPEGMPFRLLVILTDGDVDLVPAGQGCADSLSFCGASNGAYPDRQPMGYPFDLPFGSAGLTATLLGLPNVAMHSFTIQTVAPNDLAI